jgi:hypothetical protein
LLRLTAGGPAKRVRLVAFTLPVLAPRTLDQSWSLLGREVHTTDDGQSLTVDDYQVSDLETGERHVVHLAGDVLLAAPGVELEELETPPSDFPTASQVGGANPPPRGGAASSGGRVD